MKEHKLAAIVFTDIVGYTRRMESDEEATMKLLARQREIVFPLVNEFGGEVIKEIGDGLLMMFKSANRAVRFAMEVQELLKDDELTIRAGIHIGDVIFEDRDVFGSAVNIAARIEPLAQAGGICISEDVRSQIRNQKDILTRSIGKKELKGVNEEIEIFQVVDSAEEEVGKIPFYKDLWRRRVIQIVSLYLVFSFLIRLSIDYFVQSYLLSPYLTTLVWYIMLSLTPSIILISYFHGRKGVSRWKKIEIMGLTVNIIASILALLFIFQGKDLGSMTTSMTIQGEDGVEYEKLVVKNEFRKKILIFFMENTSDDPEMDYLQYAIPEMTELDLSQDLQLSPQTSMSFYSRLLERGYDEPVNLPITIMKKYAEQRHVNYFMYGKINRDKDEYVLDVTIFETEFTRLVSEISLRDKNLFSLVDQLSKAVKKDLGVPESRVIETDDFPISEIFTNSEKALKSFTLSLKERAMNNWIQELELLEASVKEDPDFAVAHTMLSYAYLNQGKMDKAVETLNFIELNLLHKLPERNQFIIKYVNYVLTKQPDKALSVVKMWSELFPDDIIAYRTLAERSAVRNMIPDAIRAHKEILRLDPEEFRSLGLIGDFYLQLGEFDSSLVYYEHYAKKLPQLAEPYRKLGVFYASYGDMDLAQENYEKALIMAEGPQKVVIKMNLATVLLNSGKFDEAYQQCLEALKTSLNTLDSVRVYTFLEDYYLLKGQAEKSLESLQLRLKLSELILPPNDYLSHKITNLQPYIATHKIDEAFTMIEEIAKQVEPPWDQVIPFGLMVLYAETGEVEKAEEAIAQGEEFLNNFGQEIMMMYIYRAEGRLYENLGDYEVAIESYTNYLKLNPIDQIIHANLSRCYRNLKDFKKAESEILQSLEHNPFSPIANYEAALLYFETGKEDEGLKHLRLATEIWKDADPDYKWAKLAKEKLKEISG